MSNHPKKLKKAPLKEVIFEIHWKLEIEKNGKSIDPKFDFGKGIFHQQIKERFPFSTDIKYLINLPFPLVDTPLHQFWTGEKTWPVIQLGQGILTVNDTDINYVWEDNFKSNIDFALNCLEKSHGDNIPFFKATLKYLDVVDINEADNANILDYIKNSLQVDIQNKFKIEGKYNTLNISQTFTMADESELSLVISNGKKVKTFEPVLIWNTGISKSGEFKKGDIIAWAENGHRVISDMFHTMMDRKFYEQFN